MEEFNNEAENNVPLKNFKGTIILKNPRTGDIKRLTVHTGGTLTFLFGPFYLAHHRVLLHAGICAAIDLVSGGGGNIIYVFFAKKLIVNKYLKNGYKVIAHYQDGKEPK